MTQIPPLLPYAAYEVGMTVIRARLLYLDSKPADAHPLMAAEKIAFQVRKIIEGVAFAALSAVEYRNGQMMSDHRGKDADKLLTWLAKKRLLRLPSARRVEPAPDPSPAHCLGSLIEASDLDHDRRTVTCGIFTGERADPRATPGTPHFGGH